jgi:hypothetical protein
VLAATDLGSVTTVNITNGETIDAELTLPLQLPELLEDRVDPQLALCPLFIVGSRTEQSGWRFGILNGFP